MVTAIAAVCNTHAAFSALFVADAETAGAATGWVADVAQAMTGGIDKMTIVVNFSEELEKVASAQFTITGITCTGQAIKAVAATNAGTLTGSVAILCNTNETVVAGVDTVTVAANALTVDRAGNQMNTTGAANVTAIYPG